MSTTDFVAATAAVASALAAGASWRAALKANSTASSVAAIERDRWHSELTPRVQATVELRTQTLLLLKFEGPAGLRRLERVTLSIRDDRDRRGRPVLGGAPTDEEIAAVIWGPLRFRPGSDNADATGRTVAPFTLELDEARPFALDPSLRPRWYDEDRWRAQYADAPLRLWIVCETDGHKPWTLSFEVGQDGIPVRNPRP
ncbi:hypothetical protein [Streptomyces melanogenes]|uniref:hypothetical protein n=1 Tax=Streptomyces melanogenes TaxID=67326 RepID=UPI00167DE2FC|nr:hypothetical protein [Streptomyces melanogenes]GGP93346.1 hypothetical protein GCM10010278_84190 [Streptomyces melanogenes]